MSFASPRVHIQICFVVCSVMYALHGVQQPKNKDIRQVKGVAASKGSLVHLVSERDISMVLCHTTTLVHVIIVTPSYRHESFEDDERI